jgi:putative ABC transport system substrate-binding protein
MRRRDFTFLVAGGVAVMLRRAAEARQAVARIGILSPIAETTATPMIENLRDGLRELGWVDGRNITFERRYADGKIDLMPQLATELARLKLDVLVVGSNPGGLAVKQATSTIPVVLVTTGDPVAGGIVDSLARPGRNITGVTAIGMNLVAKHFELLKEAAPGLNSVVMLVNPISPYTASMVAEAEAATRALALQLRVLPARDAAEMEGAFEVISNARPGAIMVPPDVLFVSARTRIVQLIAASRLPAIYSDQEFVRAGGLMSYGASLPAMYRDAASYVDRILKGATPGELPIARPTRFDLVVNLKTARALGIELPATVLARADEVIE